MPSSSEEGKKCHPCVRNILLPISQEGQVEIKGADDTRPLGVFATYETSRPFSVRRGAHRWHARGRNRGLTVVSAIATGRRPHRRFMGPMSGAKKISATRACSGALG